MTAGGERGSLVDRARDCAIGRSWRCSEEERHECEARPSILFVYFTYTKQTLKVVEAMSEVFERRGCDVHRAVIEFDEPRCAKRFETFPMPHPFARCSE